MPTRNSPVLQQIIDTLGDLVSSPQDALAKLEEHFKDSLILIPGDVHDVARHAKKLRLATTEEERGFVLDYIGRTQVVSVTIDHVEDAINTLFGEERFIEP